MKRVLLYLIVFFAGFSYVNTNNYRSIEPIRSIFSGFDDIVQSRELASLLVALMFVAIVFIFLDNRLKKL